MEKKKRKKVILIALIAMVLLIVAIIVAVICNHDLERNHENVTPPDSIETSTDVKDSEVLIVPPIIPNDPQQNPTHDSPDVEVDVDHYRPSLSPEVKDVEITYDTKEEVKNEEKNN